MRARILFVLIVAAASLAATARAHSDEIYAAQNRAVLPAGFVHLSDVAPDIVQDMRYAGYHNFLGRPVKGYESGQCILTLDAARALKAVQEELNASGLGLMVYDCYRPTSAVRDFLNWSKNPQDQIAKGEFYPAVNKKDFVELGYVARQSSHSRGSAVDLTIVRFPFKPGETFSPGQELVPCTAPYGERFNDGSIDMGTGFDCMDERSHSLSDKITVIAQQNRMLLRQIMEKHGFAPYPYEWWHFALKNEPFPNSSFNFFVTDPRK
jgi:D-alanyl-D-alanine dipeptidase